MIRFRSRDGDDGLPARLEALADAVELADQRLDQDSVAFAAHVVAKAEERLRHGTTHTLVALLGATGSGKSSVTNLVVGSNVATTGVRRPTTSSTLACLWGPDDAGPLLDWLEVTNRHRVEGVPGHPLDGLVLLDVPDHDSIQDAHRQEMERIAEHADVLVWVTDPEKYADKAMHDYLARLGGHGAVTALLLNKTDLLDPDQAEACRTDLIRLLGPAGLDGAPVVALSTATGAGRELLVEVLAEAVAGKRAAVDRLAADTTMAADELLSGLGDDGPTKVPTAVADRLAADLAGASGIDAIGDAVAAARRRDGASVTGWPFTRWLRRLRPHPLRRLHLDRGSAGRASLPSPSGAQEVRTTGALRDATDAVTADLPEPWPAHVRQAAIPDDGVLADRIDVAVADAVRQGRPRDPRWWWVVGLLQWLLAAATVVGALWLALLALAAYLRLPEPPTPELRGFPIPTLALLGGIGLGLIVAAVAGRLNRLGGQRRARAVRRGAERAVADVSSQLVVDPIQAELDRYHSLRELLIRARGR